MGDKIYDYKLYAGKDLKLTQDNFLTESSFAACFGLNADDIVFTGSKSYIGSGGSVSEGFTITIHNLDSQFGLLKAKDIYDKNIHPAMQSGNQVVLTFSANVIQEISLGEMTLHKVYNSYQWKNQDTQRQESYWPYGCILEEKVNDTDHQVRIDNNTEYDTLKRYSIPKFYTDDHSISGYGWYRKAQSDEILNNTSGYQTKHYIGPFNTNRPRQMLFCPGQLRDPGFTILYNGGDGDFMNADDAQYIIDEDQISIVINNKTQNIYQLAPGDVLVQYQFTPTAKASFVETKESLGIGCDRRLNSFTGMGEDHDRNYYYKKYEDGEPYPCMRPVPEIYSQTEEGGMGQPVKIIGIRNKDQTYDVQGSINHNKESINILRIAGDERIRDDMNLYKILLTYTNISFQGSFITQASNVTLGEFLATWKGKMDSGLVINGLITVKNVPILTTDQKTYNKQFPQQNISMSSFTANTTLAGNEKSCNASGSIILKSKLLPDESDLSAYFPLFESGVVATHWNNDYMCGAKRTIGAWYPPGFYNLHKYNSPTHSCYVVGHFQVPSDATT